MEAVTGQHAERIMFYAIKKYFESKKDDVVVLHSHKFLQNSNEKDFVVINLSKGYVMAIEVKTSASIGNFQKAHKQLFDTKESIEAIFGSICGETEWLFLGVFFALKIDPKSSATNENTIHKEDPKVFFYSGYQIFVRLQFFKFSYYQTIHNPYYRIVKCLFL